jgi:hypothetical protein
MSQNRTSHGRAGSVWFEITMKSDLAEEEQSVTLYHEILEAAAVASPNPPTAVIDFNEGDFERAAHSAHKEFGVT